MTNFEGYHEIAEKLKKRFTLRKPNLHEVADDFRRLSKDLLDSPEYAGFSMLSAAQCEHNIAVELEQHLIKINESYASITNTAVDSWKFIIATSQLSRFGSSSFVNASNSQGKPKSNINTDSKTGRLLFITKQAEFKSTLESARLFRKTENINAAICAYSEAISLAPPRMASLLYVEKAKLYLERER